jgi:hypothetical protein
MRMSNFEGKPKEKSVEEVHHQKAIDYLKSFQELGPEEFLAVYPHAILLESYLAPSSRTKLGRVETIAELDINDLDSQTKSHENGPLLQARVIPLEKRDKSSSERMLFVGRSPNNDIVVPNKMVSKLHAYFCQVPGSEIIQLVDMNSTNGTFINGKKISPSVKMNLQDEDVISFGPETRMAYFSATGFCQLLESLV